MRPRVPGILLVVIGIVSLLRNLGFDPHPVDGFAIWRPLAPVALGAGCGSRTGLPDPA